MASQGTEIIATKRIRPVERIAPIEASEGRSKAGKSALERSRARMQQGHPLRGNYAMDRDAGALGSAWRMNS